MNKTLFFLFFFYSFFSQASSGGIYKVIFPKKNTLVSAVYNGDINKEKALIKKEIIVNKKTGERKEIIVNKKTGERIDVSNMGLVELSKIEGMAFIEQETINLTFPRINTLHSAVYKGDIKKVKALIKKGVNVNNKIGERIVDERGLKNPSLKKILDKLKKIPANQWTYAERGTTALHWIRNDNVEIAKLLIDNGADVNAKTKKFFETNFGKFTSSPTISIPAQSTPLDLAILNEHIKTAKLLIDNGAYINTKKDNYGDTPLHKINNIDIIKLLIDKGTDVNVKNKIGNTPLYYAKDLEIAKLLIDNGADVNAKNNQGNTPLHYAQNLEIAKLLIDNGADIYAKSGGGNTPLYYAKDLEIAKLLIDNGADVNAKNKIGNTPLYYAKDLEIAKLLIDNGADVNLINNSGKSLCDTPASIQKKTYIKKRRGCFPLIIIPKKIWQKIKTLFKRK